MKVSFNGFEEKYLTFTTSDPIEVGRIVALSDNGSVSGVGEEEEFMGVAVAADDDYVTVLMKGVAEIEYSGTISAPGYYCLVADEDGIATPSDDGKIPRLVLEVDSTNSKIKVLF